MINDWFSKLRGKARFIYLKKDDRSALGIDGHSSFEVGVIRTGKSLFMFNPDEASIEELLSYIKSLEMELEGLRTKKFS